jgi:hypothetical protein
MSNVEDIINQYNTILANSASNVFNLYGNAVDFNNIYNKNSNEAMSYLLHYTDNTDFNFTDSEFTKDTNDEISALAIVFLANVPKKYFNRDYYFSITNEQTSKVIREGNAKIAAEINRTSRKALINNIYHSATRGLSPTAIAREFKATIGLSEPDELAVHNYRRFLENNERDALRRKLRDLNYDDTIDFAITNQTKLSQKQIDEITNSYRERLKKFRADNIANNESLRAASIAQYESIVQAKQAGALDTTSIRRFWVTSGDEKVRVNHRAIPGMNPQGVLVDQSFKTPNGLLKYPRDPNGSLSNIINCRCKVVYKTV